MSRKTTVQKLARHIQRETGHPYMRCLAQAKQELEEERNRTMPDKINTASRPLIPVVLESPFSAPTPEGIQENIAYARRCIRDALDRGEAPIASHLLFTQDGILDDTVPEERAMGMLAGWTWTRYAQRIVVYVDRGVSKGMEKGIEVAQGYGIPIFYRKLIGVENFTREESLTPPDFKS